MKKIYAVGLGPGSHEEMTYRAKAAIEGSEVIVGYHVYVEQVKTLIKGQKVLSTGMGGERERCLQAIEEAGEGRTVSMVCSGDAGLYGMSGLLFELLEKLELRDQIELEVVPGVTSALSCASLLGAPIVEDFCTISLSDYMTPGDKIHKRLAAASDGDFVIALYNPRSLKRPEYLREAMAIVSRFRAGDTPVGIVKNAYRPEQEIHRTTIDRLPYEKVDMFSTVVIGNSKTRWIGDHMVTSRGYQL